LLNFKAYVKIKHTEEKIMIKPHKLILIATAAVFLIGSVVVGAISSAANDDIVNTIYRVNERSRNYAQTSGASKKEALEKADDLRAELGGVVCWGDYNTVGVEGYSYCDKVRELLMAQGLSLSVVNLGIAGEDSRSVLGRQGGVPLVVGSTVIGRSPELQGITVTSKDGSEVNVLCRADNPGLNPVQIAGVDGLIGGVADENDKNKTASFYFRRSTSGSSVTIPAGTPVVTHTDKAYNSYVNVFWVGDNGGWDNNPQKLLEQLKSATDLVDNDRYIVIGLSEGDTASNADIDKLLSDTFGDRYINPRELVNHTYSVKHAGDISTEDTARIARGQLAKGALNINGRINREGLEAIGQRVVDIINNKHYLTSTAN
jgi:hypothetical protein